MDEIISLVAKRLGCVEDEITTARHGQPQVNIGRGSNETLPGFFGGTAYRHRYEIQCWVLQHSFPDNWAFK